MLLSKRRDAIIDSQIRWINKRTYNAMDREGIWTSCKCRAIRFAA